MKSCIEKFSVTLTCLPLVCIGALLAPDATAGGPSQSGASKSAPAALYQSYCSVCHGDQGNGQSRARASLNPPPTDFTGTAARASLPRERMIASVREGRPGTAMVGWKTQLSDAQIALIVDYVREKFMATNAQPAAAGGKMSTPVPAAPHRTAPAVASASARQAATALKGDKAAGGRLYEKNCVACHGIAGDGKGPRAYFIFPKPRSFVTAESRAAFSLPILIHAIAQGKLGTEMPSWDKVLTDQEIADIAEFVFQRFITANIAPGARERK